MRVKTLILASSAAGALALSAGAASAEPNGWYGAIDAGWHTIDPLALESSATGVEWDWEVNDGWAAFARLGYRFNPNWRVELEGGYRSGDIGTVRRGSDVAPSGLCNVTPATGPCHSPEGGITATTLMANVIYDFGTEFWGLRPFVGLGAGINHVSTDAYGIVRTPVRTPADVFGADDSSTKFAAQALAGVAFALGERANIDLTYRYLIGDMSFDTTTFTPTTNFGTWDGEYKNSHTVTLGLRYSFGPTAAPPPPPPPPPP
ncbi:porin family protein, partial [Brevundimonas sp. S30B]|uniref:outer membrane protein n=2 Tax=unclassified Brevundimonas TaxID=2622653 RepID=UPI00107189D9